MRSSRLVYALAVAAVVALFAALRYWTVRDAAPLEPDRATPIASAKDSPRPPGSDAEPRPWDDAPSGVPKRVAEQRLLQKVPGEGGGIAGRILSSCGDLLEEARVWAVRAGNDGDPSPIEGVVQAGRYHVATGRGRFRLQGAAGELTGVELVCIGGTETVEVDMVLSHATSAGVRYFVDGKWSKKWGGERSYCTTYYGRELTCSVVSDESGAAGSYDPDASWFTDADGRRVRVAGVLSLPCGGPWTVTVLWGTAEVSSLVVHEPRSVIDVRLSEEMLAAHAATVKGRLPMRVRPDDELGWGVSLEVDPRQRRAVPCRPDASGSFVLGNVPPGEYFLHLHSAGRFRQLPLHLESGQTVDLELVDLPDACNVWVLVVGALEEPVACHFWIGTRETGGACQPQGNFQDLSMVPMQSRNPLTGRVQDVGAVNVAGLIPGRYLLGLAGNCDCAVNPIPLTVTSVGGDTTWVSARRGTKVVLQSLRSEGAGHLHVVESESSLVVWCEPSPPAGETYAFELLPGDYHVSHGTVGRSFALGSEGLALRIGDVGVLAEPLPGEGDSRR